MKIKKSSEEMKKKDDKKDEKDEKPEEVARLSAWGAIIILIFATVLIAIVAEILTGTIQDVTVIWGISQTFVGMILLPIAGNAAEHYTSVVMAIKNKMTLSLGVALGSSIQIAIFVIPLLVLISWGLIEPMDLVFLQFETIALILSVFIVIGVTSDGASNWLEGVMLMAAYLILAVGFFFHQDPTTSP